MWKVGDRVLARRPPEVFWYPGTIRHMDGERYYLIFEDGEDGFASAKEMTASRFEAGDRVQVYQAASGDYLPARVVTAAGENVNVRYLNQEEQAVPLSKVRIQPQLWKQAAPTAEEAAAHDWEVCDRVLACWYDLDWYPGIVLGTEPGRVHVLFDTGTQAMLTPIKVRPFRLAANDPMLCRRAGGRDFFTGKILGIDGEKIQVQYDDGEMETTSVRLLRLRRDEWLPGSPGLRVQAGGRVLAQWYDLYWYPGIVLSIDGKRLHIAYDDGDQAMVTPDQIAPLRVEVDSRVFCRRKGGPEYLPAIVKEQEGDRILVAYDDGGEEWTSVRMVRVEK